MARIRCRLPDRCEHQPCRDVPDDGGL